MPLKVFNIDLDIKNTEYKLAPYVEVVSGDTDTNMLNIQLLEDFAPVNTSGNTAVIAFEKPDRKTVFQNLTIVDANIGKYSCTLSSQTIAVPGRVKAEVSLYEGTKRITSTRLEFIVRKALLDEGTIESSNEYSALTEALSNVQQYDNRITSVEQEQMTHEADITSLQNEVQNSVAAGSVSLSTSAPVASIAAKVNGGLEFEMEAQPLLVNLLGKDGDCEDVNKFQTRGTKAIDTANKVFGAGCLKLTYDGTAYPTAAVSANLKNLIGGKKIFVSAYRKADVESAVATDVFSIGDTTGGSATYAKTSPAVKLTTTMTRHGAKFDLSDSGSNNLYLRTLQGASTPTWTNAFVDGISIYELTNDEYNLTVDQLLVKYPYVNGIQPMMGLDVKACGKNLLNSAIIHWEQGNTSSVVGGKIDYVSSTTVLRQRYFYAIPVKPNVIYTLSSPTFNNYRIGLRFIDKNGILLAAYSTVTQMTQYTSPANSAYAVFVVSRVDSGAILTSEIANVSAQFEEGASATAYEPYQASELLIEGEFAGIGAYRDKLTYKNGAAKVLRKVKKKIVASDDVYNMDTVSSGTVDYIAINKPVDHMLNGNGDWSLANSKVNVVDGFTPVVGNEQQGNSLYNGSSARITLAVPKGTYASLAAAKTGLTGKVWWYVLASPVEELLNTPINGLSVYQGKTTIAMRTGIVKERAYPTQNISNLSWYINEKGLSSSVPDCPLKYKTNNILAVMKNNAVDNWDIYSGGANQNGGAYASIVNVKYNPKATYEVIYEVLHEEYNSQQVSFTAQYAENLRDSHNVLVKTVSSIQTELGDMWASLLPLADKEISMAAIALLTTETTADLKAKVNAILNVWR